MEFKTVRSVKGELSEEEKDTLIEACDILKDLAGNLRVLSCRGVFVCGSVMGPKFLDDIANELKTIARNPLDIRT